MRFNDCRLGARFKPSILRHRSHLTTKSDCIFNLGMLLKLAIGNPRKIDIWQQIFSLLMLIENCWNFPSQRHQTTCSSSRVLWFTSGHFLALDLPSGSTRHRSNGWILRWFMLCVPPVANVTFNTLTDGSRLPFWIIFWSAVVIIYCNIFLPLLQPSYPSIL